MMPALAPEAVRPVARRERGRAFDERVKAPIIL
jgi:hypothetical protein